jgi:hypothetical protein
MRERVAGFCSLREPVFQERLEDPEEGKSMWCPEPWERDHLIAPWDEVEEEKKRETLEESTGSGRGLPLDLSLCKETCERKIGVAAVGMTSPTLEWSTSPTTKEWEEIPLVAEEPKPQSMRRRIDAAMEDFTPGVRNFALLG